MDNVVAVSTKGLPLIRWAVLEVQAEKQILIFQSNHTLIAKELADHKCPIQRLLAGRVNPCNGLGSTCDSVRLELTMVQLGLETPTLARDRGFGLSSIYYS